MDFLAVWRQRQVPVIYLPAKGLVRVGLPYSPDNRDWLRGFGNRRPEWADEGDVKFWRVPRSWFTRLIHAWLERYGRTYVIQRHRSMEKCGPACWYAKGEECSCSCLGRNHGQRRPGGRWHVVSEALAVRWDETDLRWSLLVAVPKKHAPTRSLASDPEEIKRRLRTKVDEALRRDEPSLIRVELQRIGAKEFKLYVAPDRGQFQAKDSEPGQAELSGSSWGGEVADVAALLAALRRVPDGAGDNGIAKELLGA